MNRRDDLESGARSVLPPIAPPLVVLVVLAALALPGLVTGPWLLRAAAAGRAERQITITNFAFSQPTLTVPAGSTVTWVNDDEEPHTVTAKDRSFTSPGLDQSETFTHRFDRPGTYSYFCAIHPHMTATIVVR
jgi:plastocyanin